MSILIKDMEMPKNCDDCFFIGRGYPDWCSLPQIPNGEDEIGDTKKRPDWCPLIELPVQPERKTGEWEPYLKEGLPWKCSECDSRFKEPYHYCPNCGAIMEGKKDDVSL